MRAYALTDPSQRPRVSPAQFDLRRFQRFGLLGLVDGQPLRRGSVGGDFEIHVIPLGAEDVRERLTRLCELLGGLLRNPQGGEDATGRTVREGLDGPAGEGGDDGEGIKESLNQHTGQVSDFSRQRPHSRVA